MVLEVATLDIHPDKIDQFESDIGHGLDLIRQTKGCLSLVLYRCQEQLGRYQLHVGWETIEDHIVTYRQSEGAKVVSGLLGRFLAGPPTLQHYSKLQER